MPSKKYTDDEKRLIEINNMLAKLFHYNLTAINKNARDYLHNRSVDDKQINELNLGFLPEGQLLKMAEGSKQFTTSDLLNLGYLKYDENGNIREHFPNKIMIPIQDEKGNIVSFVGRTLEKDFKPKYLHTAENSIFHKKDLLYNFFNAKPLAYNGELIIVEGFLDVAGARRLGFENVVATMGIALSEEHLKLIRRNHSSITLALDNDQAGLDAMIRTIPELLKKGFLVNVLDISKVGSYKDFGDLSENNIPYEDIIKGKISGFSFLLDHKYFNDKKLNVENIYLTFKELKKDNIINNTYDESGYKEYIISKTNYSKYELDEILYPKRIVQKENPIDNFTSRATINFLYSELLSEAEKRNDKVLSVYFANHKSEIERRLINIFNNNPSSYLSETSNLNKEKLLNDFLKGNKEYSDYESLNRFKYINVFNKTYIKNSNGSARVKLNEKQTKQVIKQFENSLSDKDKLALEEVEELYIINSIDDIDGILSYDNKTLKLLKENIKERLFLNKDKMDFFKFGSLFSSINKDFIDDRFKGQTGNFKTILFYNNLDNNLVLDKKNIIKNDDVEREQTNRTISIDNNKEIQQDFFFSVNKVLIDESHETDTHYFIRIPNTDAKEYMFIAKSDCDWKDSDEIFYTSLKYNDTYPIYNKNGEYLYDKSFSELKVKWEDKSKNKNQTSEEIIQEAEALPTSDIIYDNSYTSKYKEPICKVYKSKVFVATEKGFYIKTDNPSVLVFATKKVCNWTDDMSYLIVCPKKSLFNSGISKYKLDGYKKTFDKKLNYSEINQYLKMFNPKEFKQNNILKINIPKYKCNFYSNFVRIPLVIDEISGYINVNLIKTKIDKEKVTLEINPNEQLSFHDNNGNYIKHFTGLEISNNYKEMEVNSDLEKSNDSNILMYEKEEAA